jgi:hypothetical protein
MATPENAPVDLQVVKDDLGITDDTSDAWLQRRVNGLWARFQRYTARPLMLSSGWADDWGELVQNHPANTEPPIIRAAPSASVFLRVFPVQSISKFTVNGADQDASRVLFDGESGKLLGLDGRACDIAYLLPSARVRIEYKAGFESLPADLYEAVVGALLVQWNQRQASASGLGPAGLTASRISAMDVGDVELTAASNFFVDQATRRGGTDLDPLLGAFADLLDPYIDWRSMLGGAYPTTVALLAPPPAP